MKSEEELIWDSYYRPFRYYRREEDFLKESPVHYKGNYVPSNLNRLYQEVMDKSEGFQKVHSFKYNDMDTSIYLKVDGSIHYLNLISEENKMGVGNIIYNQISSSEIELESIYNHPQFKGLIHQVFFDVLLEDYGTIISSGLHSTDGRDFWANVFRKGFDSGEKFDLMMVDMKTKEKQPIDTIEDLSKYYGGSDEFIKYHNYKFVIRKRTET